MTSQTFASTHACLFFFKDIVDVVSDGHCEFQTVSKLLGRSIESYSIIYIDLALNVNNNYEGYIWLFGPERRFRHVKRFESWWSQPSSYSKWL